MEVRLGDSGLPCEPAFRGYAAANAVAKVFEKALLQIKEIHGFSENYFSEK